MKTALSLALLLVAFAIGACSPEWIVIKQASPNPMTASSRFLVEKATFAPNLHVGKKTEAEWLSEKKPEAKDSWDEDKAAMADKFTAGFMAAEKDGLLLTKAPGAGVFGVRARYVQFDPGYYVLVAYAPAVLDAEVEFLDASGNVLDVIRINVSRTDFVAGERARYCAKEVGAIAAKYLEKRIGR